MHSWDQLITALVCKQLILVDQHLFFLLAVGVGTQQAVYTLVLMEVSVYSG